MLRFPHYPFPLILQVFPLSLCFLLLVLCLFLFSCNNSLFLSVYIYVLNKDYFESDHFTLLLLSFHMLLVLCLLPLAPCSLLLPICPLHLAYFFQLITSSHLPHALCVLPLLYCPFPLSLCLQHRGLPFTPFPFVVYPLPLALFLQPVFCLSSFALCLLLIFSLPLCVQSLASCLFFTLCLMPSTSYLLHLVPSVYSSTSHAIK